MMRPLLRQQIKNRSKRWLSGCLLIFLVACTHKEPTIETRDGAITVDEILSVKNKSRAFQLIKAIRDSILPGDMITRTGNDFTSYCLRQFCQTDKTYSHCGIASIENDTVFVYHTLGGEFNPDQKLLREPLHVFATPAANTGFGVFRFDLTKTQSQQLITITQQTYRQGISFDMDFDLATDDKMYCSEFTAKMYRRLWNNDTMFSLSRIGHFEFLAPDNLFSHRLCRQVCRAKY